MNLIKIVSGGQTGTDIAAIDFAIENGLKWGGWIPKNRRNDDSIIPAKYTKFIEADTSNYLERTKLNAEDSDGTLIILPFDKKIGGGSIMTIKYAEQYGNPVITVNLKENPNVVLNWIKEHNIKILNVASARERYTPGIYDASKKFLYDIFKNSNL